MKKRLFLAATAALMILAASCGQNATTKSNAEQPALSESKTATDTDAPANNILAALLRNRANMKSLSNIVESGGKVYTYFNENVPSEWIYTGEYSFAVVGSTMIYTSSDGFEYPTELHCSDLKGNNVKVINNDINQYYVWIYGNKVIYAAKNQSYEHNKLFCYDVKTFKSTFLCETSAYNVVSCNDDYVYYKTDTPSVVGRIRWDGTGEEYLEGVPFPEDLYKVEEETYYCVTSAYDYESGTGTTSVSVYSINNNKQEDTYTLNANQLITLKEGYAYYGNKSGIYGINLLTDQTVWLAYIDPELPGNLTGTGFAVGYVYGDYLYFDVNYEDDGWVMARLYKAPLIGGKMEYLNQEWAIGGF